MHLFILGILGGVQLGIMIGYYLGSREPKLTPRQCDLLQEKLWEPANARPLILLSLLLGIWPLFILPPILGLPEWTGYLSLSVLFGFGIWCAVLVTKKGLKIEKDILAQQPEQNPQPR